MHNTVYHSAPTSSNKQKRNFDPMPITGAQRSQGFQDFLQA
jgi:hypothetical protein